MVMNHAFLNHCRNVSCSVVEDVGSVNIYVQGDVSEQPHSLCQMPHCKCSTVDSTTASVQHTTIFSSRVVAELTSPYLVVRGMEVSSYIRFLH